jgi:hypothetical protein
MAYTPLDTAIHYATNPETKQGQPRSVLKTYMDARNRMFLATMELGGNATGLPAAYQLLGRTVDPQRDEMLRCFRDASIFAHCMAQGCYAAATDGIEFDASAPEKSFKHVLPAGMALAGLIDGLGGAERILRELKPSHGRDFDDAAILLLPYLRTGVTAVFGTAAANNRITTPYRPTYKTIHLVTNVGHSAKYGRALSRKGMDLLSHVAETAFSLDT